MGEAHRNVESDKDIAKAAAHFAQRVKATAQLQLEADALKKAGKAIKAKEKSVAASIAGVSFLELEANPQQLDAGHKANAELRGKAAGLKVMTNSLKKMKGSKNVKKALEDAKKVADAEEKKVTSAALAHSKAHAQKLASGGAKSAMADAALKKLQLNKALNNLKATQKAHAENAKAAEEAAKKALAASRKRDAEDQARLNEARFIMEFVKTARAKAEAMKIVNPVKGAIAAAKKEIKAAQVRNQKDVITAQKAAGVRQDLGQEWRCSGLRCC